MPRPRSLEHTRYLELAAASIDFDLDPTEAAALTSHLAVCDACRREAAELQADARSLRRLADGAPSAVVRERVLSSAGAVRRRPSPLILVAAAAVIAVAAVGGLSAGALVRTTREAALPISPAWSALSRSDTFPSGAGLSSVLGLASVSDLGATRLVAVGTGGGDGRVWLSTDGQAWALAGTTGLADARPVAVAAAGGRVVAVGHIVRGGDSVATAWASTDARTWVPTEFAGSTGLTSVVASPARVVVAGTGRSGSGLAIWSSTDGRSWTPGSQSPPYTRANVTGIALGGPGFVAVGYDDVGAVVWTSADGLRWVRTDSPSFASARMTGVAATPGGLVAVGGDALGALAWTSADGLTWLPTDHFGGPGARPTAVAATPFGILAVGGPAGAVRAWTSTDGRQWSAVSGGAWPAEAQIDTVVARGSLVIVAGSSGGRADLWIGRPPPGDQ